jgi:threonine/homoserine/homoserine lactone efflux protein
VAEYLFFTTAFFLAAVAPGADTLLILSRALADRKAALLAGAGITLAKVAMVSAAFLGLAAVLSSLPALLWALRVFGATFLIWRAFRLWNTGRSEERKTSKGGEFLSAFAIGFSNPQPFAFYLSIVPLVVGRTELPILLLIVIVGFSIVTFIYMPLLPPPCLNGLASTPTIS